MKHRLHLPQKERFARSKANKLIHDKSFIAGSLVKMARTCGKANCKCTKGDKHVSLYLVIRRDGRRKMIFIPRQWEAEVIDWVNTYKEIAKQIAIVSEACAERITEAKKKTG
jgi:hypothetical protein